MWFYLKRLAPFSNGLDVCVLQFKPKLRHYLWWNVFVCCNICSLMDDQGVHLLDLAALRPCAVHFALVSSSSKSKRYHLRCQPSMCYDVFACGDYFWCQPSLYFNIFVQSISKRSPLFESWSSNQPPRLHRIWCFHQQKLWQNSFNMEKIMGWKRGQLSLFQICISVDVSIMVSGYDLVSLEAKQGPSCGLASGPCAYNAAIEIDTSFLSYPLHQSPWLKF